MATTSSREESGRILARSDAVSPRSSVSWTVHGNKDYVVLMDPETCTCVDWAMQHNKGLDRRCKHVWAVLFTLDQITRGEAVRPRSQVRFALEV